MSYKIDLSDYGDFKVCFLKNESGYIHMTLTSSNTNFISECIKKARSGAECFEDVENIDEFCARCQKPILKDEGRQRLAMNFTYCMNCQLKGVQP